MLKNILKLQGVQELSKQKQKAVRGGAIDGVCCFNSADHFMNDVPNYADPSAEGYLTHAQRHDIWLYAYDACMDGLEAVCAPAQ